MSSSCTRSSSRTLTCRGWQHSMDTDWSTCCVVHFCSKTRERVLSTWESQKRWDIIVEHNATYMDSLRNSTKLVIASSNSRRTRYATERPSTKKIQYVNLGQCGHDSWNHMKGQAVKVAKKKKATIASTLPLESDVSSAATRAPPRVPCKRLMNNMIVAGVAAP